MAGFELTVSNIEKENGDATSVYFELPDVLKPRFNWLPGQHISISLSADRSDNSHRNSRCYSISAPPGQPLRITVKAVKKGRVSTYINNALKMGDKVIVTPPSGRFVLSPDKTRRRTHYFFAAGSGITPIYSMLVSVLQKESESYVCLLYGNKDHKNTLFAEQLTQLQQTHADRLVVRDCHSSASWFRESPWRSSRIDAAAVQDFIKENPPYAQDCQYYLCGPGSFLPDVRQALRNIDVPDSRIHMESFGGKTADNIETGVSSKLTVQLKCRQHQVAVAKGQTLLRSMLDNNIAAPYSCEGGVCGTCRCKLRQGKVAMANNLVLDQSEVDKGDILACQSVALTEHVSIEY